MQFLAILARHTPHSTGRAQRGPYLGLPDRRTELLAGGLPVTPRVTATPKPCLTWAKLARVACEGTRGVLWCGMLFFGVLCGVV